MLIEIAAPLRMDLEPVQLGIRIQALPILEELAGPALEMNAIDVLHKSYRW
jgi:hypothetical protein